MGKGCRGEGEGERSLRTLSYSCVGPFPVLTKKRHYRRCVPYKKTHTPGIASMGSAVPLTRLIGTGVHASWWRAFPRAASTPFLPPSPHPSSASSPHPFHPPPPPQKIKKISNQETGRNVPQGQQIHLGCLKEPPTCTEREREREGEIADMKRGGERVQFQATATKGSRGKGETRRGERR